MAEKLSDALSSLRPDDIRLDPLGRVVITSPSVIDAVKEAGEIQPDELAAARRGDTNIICCGNTKCAARGTDLGSVVERFAGQITPPQ